jgi:hypothetical protein
VTTTTYLGSGDASTHRRNYRPDWLDNLADDVTMEGSVLTWIAEGPEVIREILGFARTLYDYQEFNFRRPLRRSRVRRGLHVGGAGCADRQRGRCPLQRRWPSSSDRG